MTVAELCALPKSEFQPTLPVREVTQHTDFVLCRGHISTHTSREGSDAKYSMARRKMKNFNPHFPWGKWRINVNFYFISILFQPTLPVREVTESKSAVWGHYIRFQPTLPVREVTTVSGYGYVIGDISTHTSREGSDTRLLFLHNLYFLFQPTLPVREVT